MKALVLLLCFACMPAQSAVRSDVLVQQYCKHETAALAWHHARGEHLVSTVHYGNRAVETWLAADGTGTKVILWPNNVRCCWKARIEPMEHSR